LVDLSVNDDKTIAYTFSEDSAFTSLRGKEAEYHVIVEQVKSRTLPELNDEFAKSVGDFESLQALQETIREGLKTQAKTNFDGEYNQKVLAQVIEGATIQYPPEMVEDQITASIERIKGQLTEQGQEYETYLKVRGIDAAKLREQNKPQAEIAITRSVVMYELAQAESITVERKEMENEAMSTLNELMRYVTPDRFKRMSKDRNFISQLSRNASVDVLSRKTFERLNAIARGEVEASELSASETAVSEATTSEATSPEATASEAAASAIAETEVAATEAAEVEATIEPEPQPVMEIPAEGAAPKGDEPTLTEIPVTETTQQEG
jgi:trigger factor